MQSSSSRPPERTAESTGRRWISRLQRNQRVSSAVRGRALAEARDAQPVDPLAGDRQQRRQQGQRRDHREQHGDRGRHRDAVEEADAEQQHPHQRDDHGDAGEEHGAAGGVDGGDRRVARLQPLVEAVAEAGEDEERVVDADAEADHRRQLRREVGGVEDVGAERDQAEADAEGEEGGDQRQAHRHHRAEGQQQDDDRGKQADREGGVAPSSSARTSSIGAPPTLDLQVVAVRRLGRSTISFLMSSLFELVGGDVVLDGRVGDFAVFADRAGASGRVGAGDFADVRQLFRFGEDALHLLAHRRRVGPGRRLVDDFRRDARLLREPVFQQVEGFLWNRRRAA